MYHYFVLSFYLPVYSITVVSYHDTIPSEQESASPSFSLGLQVLGGTTAEPVLEGVAGPLEPPDAPLDGNGGKDARTGT